MVINETLSRKKLIWQKTYSTYKQMTLKSLHVMNYYLKGATQS